MGADDKKLIVRLALVCILIWACALARYFWNEQAEEWFTAGFVAVVVAVVALAIVVFVVVSVVSVALSLWFGLAWCWRTLRRKGGRA